MRLDAQVHGALAAALLQFCALRQRRFLLAINISAPRAIHRAGADIGHYARRYALAAGHRRFARSFLLGYICLTGKKKHS